MMMETGGPLDDGGIAIHPHLRYVLLRRHPRGADARQLNLKTISDAVPAAKNWQAGFGQDFMSRADGYAGFSKAYGFAFANNIHPKRERK